MKKRKVKIVAIALAVLSFLILLRQCIVKINKGINSVSSNKNNDLPPSFNLPLEYSKIFNKEALKYLDVSIIVNNKSKNPIASLKYKKKFFLTEYKIDSVIRKNGLPENIICKIKNVSFPEGESYSYIEAGNYGFNFNDNPKRPQSRIYLTFFGDSLLLPIKNDSIILYRFYCNNFSFQYEENDIPNILICHKGERAVFQNNGLFEVLFYKTKGMLFMLTFFNGNSNESFPSGILNSLIVK